MRSKVRFHSNIEKGASRLLICCLIDLPQAFILRGELESVSCQLWIYHDLIVLRIRISRLCLTHNSCWGLWEIGSRLLLPEHTRLLLLLLLKTCLLTAEASGCTTETSLSGGASELSCSSESWCSTTETRLLLLLLTSASKVARGVLLLRLLLSPHILRYVYDSLFNIIIIENSNKIIHFTSKIFYCHYPYSFF